MMIPICSAAVTFAECSEKGKSGSSVYNAINKAVEMLIESTDIDTDRIFGISAATEYGSTDLFAYGEGLIMDKGLKGFRAQLASRLILCEPASQTAITRSIKGMNLTFIGRGNGFISALEFLCVTEQFDEQHLIIAAEGEMAGDKSYGGALLLGGVGKCFLKAVRTAFSVSKAERNEAENKLFELCCADAGISALDIKRIGSIDAPITSYGVVDMILKAADMVETNENICITTSNRGILGCIIIGK